MNTDLRFGRDRRAYFHACAVLELLAPHCAADVVDRCASVSD